VNRDKQEMALWATEYVAARAVSAASAAHAADEAVAQFRLRYPPQPSAPEAVWYDEPPFEKIDKANHCWVENIDSPQAVYWSNLHGEWRFFEGVSNPRPLNGRRVCPITKPPEPTP